MAPVVEQQTSLARGVTSFPRRALRSRKLSGIWTRLGLTGFLLPLGIMVAWAIASQTGRLDPALFSSPREVVDELASLVRSGTLPAHLQATFGRVLTGFVFGLAAGTLLGTLTGSVPLIRRLLDPMVQALRSVPSMAWVPLFILWLGIQEGPRVCLIAVGAFFPVYLGVMNGISDVDRKLVEVGRACGFRGWRLVRAVTLPACLPAYLLGARHALGLAWMFVVAAEIMGASRGLGFLLVDGQTTGRPGRILASVCLFALCGKLTDGALAFVSRRLLKWQDVVVRR